MISSQKSDYSVSSQVQVFLATLSRTANTPDREDDDEGAPAVKRNEENWRGL